MEDKDRTALLDDVESHSAVVAIETDPRDIVDTQNQRVAQNPHNIESSSSQIGIIQREECFTFWKLMVATAQSVALTSIGVTGGVALWFAFKSAPITAFQLHVGLSVIGYQILMAHGILCFRSGPWSILSYRHRKRIHWILQLSGSGLAIAGSAIMMKAKGDEGKSHFSTVHGKLALAALIFNCTSVINGVISLFVVELRRFVPVKLSKLSHILCGTATIALSSACLCFGYFKKSFILWSSQELTYVLVSLVIMYNVIILLAPSYSIVKIIFR